MQRDSAESKLSSFLDLSVRVAEVIGQQDRILTKSRFRTLLKFLTGNQWWWVTSAACLTLAINVIMLLKVNPSESTIQVPVNGTLSGDDYSQQYVLGQEYIDPSWLSVIQKIGYAHLAMGVVLLINFMVGTTVVNITNGFKWKDDVVNDLVSLPVDSRAIKATFKIVEGFTPSILWTIYFVLADPLMLYYTCFVLFSALGCFYHIAFFCFHVLDVVVRIELLGYVLKSVYQNGGQVVVTFMLGAVFVWIYAVIGVFCFGFSSYNLGGC